MGLDIRAAIYYQKIHKKNFNNFFFGARYHKIYNVMLENNLLNL